jgi:hypothetical protein
VSTRKNVRLVAQIAFDDVPAAGAREIADFIRDSLAWAGGCRHPDDPMLGSLANVTVKYVRARS